MSSQRQFLDIAMSPAVQLRELVNTNHVANSLLFESHPVPQQASPLDFEPLPDIIKQAHSKTATIPDIRIYSVPDATLVGESHIIKNDLIVGASDLVPSYVHYFQTSGIARISNEQMNVRAILHHPVYCVTHFNTNNYGHFLLESLPRILTVDHLYQLGFGYPILLPSDLPEFARSIIREVNHNFVLLDHDTRGSTKIERVLLPSMCHTEYLFHNAFLGRLDLIKTRSPAQGRNRRLFVYRTEAGSQSFRRRPVNLDEVISLAHTMGFEIIRPETMSFSDQVRIFSEAKHVIGEYGSGLHNTIFSGPDTKTLVINWVNDVQFKIAQSRAQRVGFLLPDDGQPRYFSSDNNVRQDYSVDIWRVERAINRLLK